MTATSSADYRLAMCLCSAGGAAGVVSSLWPATDLPISIALAVAAAGALGVAGVRRELRIRRILAGIRPLPSAPTLDDATPPAVPAATSTNTREVA